MGEDTWHWSLHAGTHTSHAHPHSHIHIPRWMNAHTYTNKVRLKNKIELYLQMYFKYKELLCREKKWHQIHLCINIRSHIWRSYEKLSKSKVPEMGGGEQQLAEARKGFASILRSKLRFHPICLERNVSIPADISVAHSSFLCCTNWQQRLHFVADCILKQTTK